MVYHALGKETDRTIGGKPSAWPDTASVWARGAAHPRPGANDNGERSGRTPSARRRGCMGSRLREQDLWISSAVLWFEITRICLNPCAAVGASRRARGLWQLWHPHARRATGALIRCREPSFDGRPHGGPAPRGRNMRSDPISRGRARTSRTSARNGAVQRPLGSVQFRAGAIAPLKPVFHQRCRGGAVIRPGIARSMTRSIARRSETSFPST
jgi:hypothetical protein